MGRAFVLSFLLYWERSTLKDKVLLVLAIVYCQNHLFGQTQAYTIPH